MSSADSDADLAKKAAELRERAVAKSESLDRFEKATASQKERRVEMLHKACTVRLGAGTGVADLLVILEDGVDVDATLKLKGDECPMTPVFRAANTGHHRAVMCLIQHGANYEAPTSFGGLRPLHVACKQGNRETCEYLLKQGADYTTPDENGKTPWKYAFDRHDDRGKDCMYFLEKEGAEVEEKEKCVVM